MQSDLIIINDFCDRCHVDPSFITELEEDGLIEVRVIDEERYLPASQLAELSVTRIYIMTCPSILQESTPSTTCWNV